MLGTSRNRKPALNTCSQSKRRCTVRIRTASWRVRKILATAGFKDSDGSADKKGIKTEIQSERLAVRGEIHAERKEGLRWASVRDFHSFRVTWVTLALTASVPLELVQKVTGHKTVDIVLKHYFQPGREEFRRFLQTAMPKLLTNGSKTPKDQMLEILNRSTAKGWKRDTNGSGNWSRR